MYVPGVVRMFRNDLYTYTIPKACVSAYGTNVKEMSLFSYTSHFSNLAQFKFALRMNKKQTSSLLTLRKMIHDLHSYMIYMFLVLFFFLNRQTFKQTYIQTVPKTCSPSEAIRPTALKQAQSWVLAPI